MMQTNRKHPILDTLNELLEEVAEENKRKQVSSEDPWMLVLLVDGSHSMGADWGASKRSLAEAVEQAVNHLLYDMALNFCVTDQQGDEGIKDRIHVKILVYNQEDMVMDPLPGIKSSFSRASGDDGWVKNYSDQHPYPDSRGGSIVIPRWISLDPEGTTPMLAAFKEAREAIDEHMKLYPESVAPVLLNVSDGEPTDCGDPVDWSLLKDEFNDIVSLGEDGNNPVVCNVHLGALADHSPLLFPSEQPSVGGLESGLWNISSRIPEEILEVVEEEYRMDHEEERRFFIFNSDLIHFHRFLHFSTKNVTGTLRKELATVIDADFEVFEEE